MAIVMTTIGTQGVLKVLFQLFQCKLKLSLERNQIDVEITKRKRAEEERDAYVSED